MPVSRLPCRPHWRRRIDVNDELHAILTTITAVAPAERSRQVCIASYHAECLPLREESAPRSSLEFWALSAIALSLAAGAYTTLRLHAASIIQMGA